MCTPRRSIRKGLGALLGLALFAAAGAAFAQDAPPPGAGDQQDDPPSRVARLSYLRGDVSFQPAGGDDWVQADLNRPLGTGDKIYTDRDSRVEMEVGAATLRLDAQSSFDVLNLNDSVAQTELTEGIVNLHVRRVFEGQSYEVDTPTLAFVITQPGDYRVDIGPDGNSTMVTVFNGSGDVYGENNASYSVQAGNSYRFNDSALHDYEVVDLPRPDDFDNWVQSRNDRNERAPSRQYVSQDVIGYADLDDYGGWDDVPEYGHVWYPTNVEAGWAPYRSGHWSWIDPWGWTWVDNAAWGFAPFHYGRWALIGNRWGWCPGPIGVRPIYAPALVAFVGGGGFAIAAGPVGWFPLSPRDVYVPWYHASRNYFTNVNVRNTTVINNTYITNVYNNYSRGSAITNVNYAYRTNTNAVTAVSRDTFVGARAVNAGRVAINENQLRNANVVSRVGIAPQRQSFVAANAARAVPNAATLNRNVIARTPPPPRPAPVATRIAAIQKNNDQPLATQQLRRIGTPAVATGAAGATAVNRGQPSRVTLVGQGAVKPKPLPLRAGAATQTNTVQRGPANTMQRGTVNATGANNVHTPATNANGQTHNATVESATGKGLPSSRFAPHAGQSGAPTSTMSRTTGAGGTNVNPRATINNNATRTVTPTGGNPNATTGRTLGPKTNATETGQNAINRSTTNNNIQHTPVNPTLHRAPVTTNSSQGGGGQGNQTQTTIKSRSVQPQERVYSQPKTPQTYTQPKGPQNYEHAVPQTQTHTPPPPPPPPQVQRNVQHAQPQERKVPADKKKDKDDNGGHR